MLDFAGGAGLAVDRVHEASRTVEVSGSVEQLARAFAVQLGMYRIEHPPRRGSSVPEVETYRGRDGFIHAPLSLVEIIVGVFGFDNRRVTRWNNADPPNTAKLTVPEIARLYNFPTNLAVGQTIGILSVEGYSLYDIQSYFAKLPAGYTVPAILDVPVDASNTNVASIETTQDICIAASAAPGAGIAVYFTTPDQKGWVDLINRVIYPRPGDPVCSVLSSSYYLADGDDDGTLGAQGITSSLVIALTNAFNDAAVHHVTVCVATGDTGTDSKLGDRRAHVQYPASDPWVLSVGGTTVGNVNGAAFAEYVWNDTSRGFGGATGGGVSDQFPLPDYQRASAIPVSVNDRHPGRAIPDVAANASPNSGYPIVVGGDDTIVASGTSAAAPLWAGLIALINAAIGGQTGFANPNLYELGAGSFRDIVGAPGPSDNGLNGAPGYAAGPGWDACTGWGSPNGAALLAGMRKAFAAGAQ